MVCAKCKYEFCWTCLGHYKSYSHDPGMEIYCEQATLIYVCLCMIFILLLIIKLCALPFIPFHLMPMNPIKYMLETVGAVDLLYYVAKIVMAKFIIASFFIPAFLRVLKPNWRQRLLVYVCLCLSYSALIYVNNFCYDVINVLLFELCILVFSIPMVFTTLCMAVSGAILGTLVFLG